MIDSLAEVISKTTSNCGVMMIRPTVARTCCLSLRWVRPCIPGGRRVETIPTKEGNNKRIVR